MKISIAEPRAARPVASNYTAKEFLAEAYIRFPQPSEFLAAFLLRFEALVELDEAVDREHHESSRMEEIICPACGSDITVEVELELDKFQ